MPLCFWRCWKASCQRPARVSARGAIGQEHRPQERRQFPALVVPVDELAEVDFPAVDRGDGRSGYGVEGVLVNLVGTITVTGAG
jgi:hypothetical protein